MFVFVYGSLLSSQSLNTTLPDVDVADCRPALLGGRARRFDVAFPNDGSQPDKAYLAADASLPPVVLFVNLAPTGSAVPVNGVLVPIDSVQLEMLRRRERRYDVVDVTSRTRAWPGTADGLGARRVVAFVGSKRFTSPEQVRRGVVPRAYWSAIVAGAGQWDRRFPGFLADFWASTRAPAADRVAELGRVDLSG